MSDEVLMQLGHRYQHARCAKLPRARIQEAGSALGTTPTSWP
ncbi:MAG TPA: hypothetical protein VNH38_04955 [Candidatus Dormibacteraeota bacterium]|nr:hypothetical protein [Candidatus Dormibacteraeota bacterium]